MFLPFIALLKAEVEIVPLDGPTDYRRLKFEGEEVYRFGVGPEVDAAMDRLWLKLTGGVAGKPETLRSLGRDIAVPEAAMGGGAVFVQSAVRGAARVRAIISGWRTPMTR